MKDASDCQYMNIKSTIQSAIDVAHMSQSHSKDERRHAKRVFDEMLVHSLNSYSNKEEHTFDVGDWQFMSFSWKYMDNMAGGKYRQAEKLARDFMPQFMKNYISHEIF